VDVSVVLNDAATQRLAELGEGIKVIVYMHGDDGNGNDEVSAPFRNVFLGSWSIKMERAGTAQLRDIKLSKLKLSKLPAGDYFVFTNVVTARWKQPNNLLRCDDGRDIVVSKTSDIHIQVNCGVL
jgi:hypothetical protein